ncbi:Nineteen complex-related protein 2 domain containing protein [Rhypophila sp. PSN 637]
MSSFVKRKPRVIQTLDDDVDLGPSLIGGEEAKNEVQIPQGPIKFGRSKPAKSSSLRKSINFNDLENNDSGAAGDDEANTTADGKDQGGTSVVIRPAISRSSSVKQKKRASTSRLSFGPSDLAADDGDAEAVTTPKKSLGKKVIENNALRRSGSGASLPPRFAAFGGEDDDDKPKYSKEYLQELQSSTPNTPQNLSSLRIKDDNEDEGNGTDLNNQDMMDLDPSELDGALIVQSQDLSRCSPSAQALTRATNQANILTEAEIRERKERRARLAQEADFIPLEDGSENSEDEHSNRVTVRFDSSKPKKSESRLIAEDEDLGEGYDEFVSDGGLALGRKAEREAERRHRQEIADMIQAAEEGSDAESDDSEAERRAAYEAAQRRAGMDGLQGPGKDDDLDGDGGGGINMIPTMKPLPDFDQVLQRMKNLVQGLEDEVARKRSRIADLEKEKKEILAKEVEVQEILNQAGKKYQAVIGATGGTGAAAPGTPGAPVPGTGAGVGAGISEAIKLSFSAPTQSPLRVPLPPGIGVDLPVERGLESFGTTPTKRPDPGAEDQDEEMF